MSDEDLNPQGVDDGGSPAPQGDEDDQLPEHDEKLGPEANKAIRLANKRAKQLAEVQGQLEAANLKARDFDTLSDLFRANPELVEVAQGTKTLDDLIRERGSAGGSAERGDDLLNMIINPRSTDEQKEGMSRLLARLGEVESGVEKFGQTAHQITQAKKEEAIVNFIREKAAGYDLSDRQLRAVRGELLVEAQQYGPRITPTQWDQALKDVLKGLSLKPRERSTAPPSTTRGGGGPVRVAGVNALPRKEALGRLLEASGLIEPE